MKSNLAKIAVRLEQAFDSLKPSKPHAGVRIDPHFGYATPDKIILRGRVLSQRAADAVEDIEEDPTLWSNFRAMAAMFITHEMENVRLSSHGITTRSDEEGYFTLALPRDISSNTGWAGFVVTLGDADDSATLPAYLPSPEAEYGVISDIDDTLLRTDAWSLRRNLWNSMTGNARSRYIFPDAVALIDKLHAGLNPVFYVSSSPWNLHAFLTEIFERAGLVKGPKFLRDLGISETQFITGTHGDHKGAAIDTIFAANPALPFILIGDTGQHDAHVYHDAILRHPGRIQTVILRAPGPGVDDRDKVWIDKIKALKTPIFVGADYAPLL